VGAVSRAGAFECDGQLEVLAGGDKGKGVFLPTVAVEIYRQEMARFIEQHGIDSDDEVLALLVLTGEVLTQDLVGHGEEATVGAVEAFDARLLADSFNPLIGAGRLVAGASGPCALETKRVNITASTEEGAKEGDFFVRWGGVGDGKGFWSLRSEVHGRGGRVR